MRTLLVLLSFLFTFSAMAEDYDYVGSSERSSRGSRGAKSFGLGVSSNPKQLYSSETAITGIYHMDRKKTLQFYLLVMSSDPLTYGLGGTFKYNLYGTRSRGFHVGGGLGLGDFAQSQSFMRFLGIAGFHFTIQKRILIHVDSSLTLANDDQGSGGKDSQFLIGGNSAWFGISLVYML